MDGPSAAKGKAADAESTLADPNALGGVSSVISDDPLAVSIPSRPHDALRSQSGELPPAVDSGDADNSPIDVESTLADPNALGGVSSVISDDPLAVSTPSRPHDALRSQSGELPPAVDSGDAGNSPVDAESTLADPNALGGVSSVISDDPLAVSTPSKPHDALRSQSGELLPAVDSGDAGNSPIDAESTLADPNALGGVSSRISGSCRLRGVHISGISFPGEESPPSTPPSTPPSIPPSPASSRNTGSDLSDYSSQVDYMNGKIESAARGCIYRVPDCLREVDDEAYTPQVVSLGPLSMHSGNGLVRKVMKKQKWRYLGEARDASSLESFLQAIEDLEQTSRQSYSENFDYINSNKFVRMMLLDGCFIIQVLLKRERQKSQSSCPDDPIFQQRWLFHKVQRDLLLLENQIPFVVLERLFELIAPSLGISDSLVTVAHEFFKDIIKGGGPTHVDNPKHLLHLLHSNLFPRPVPDQQHRFSRPPIPRPIPGATQLLAAGVEFESSNDDRLNITFQDVVLKIPHFSIEDNTKSLFLNLSAFERLDLYSHPHVTAYIFFMHCLINTAEDVAVLCRKGIIDHWLGSHQEVVDLFNNLGKDITIHTIEVYLEEVTGEIHEYCVLGGRASCKAT